MGRWDYQSDGVHSRAEQHPVGTQPAALRTAGGICVQVDVSCEQDEAHVERGYSNTLDLELAPLQFREGRGPKGTKRFSQNRESPIQMYLPKVPKEKGECEEGRIRRERG